MHPTVFSMMYAGTLRVLLKVVIGINAKEKLLKLFSVLSFLIKDLEVTCWY